MDISTRIALTSFSLSHGGGSLEDAAARVDAVVAELGEPTSEAEALAVMDALLSLSAAATL